MGKISEYFRSSSTVLPMSSCSPGMEMFMGLFFMTEAMASSIYKEIQFV